MIKKSIQLLFVLTAIGLFSACSDEKLPVVHLQGDTMGTTYNVKYVVNKNQQKVEGLQTTIDNRLQQVNKLMSTYDPESELSRFNQSRYTAPFNASEETRSVVAEALRINKLSEGALDVTVGPLVNLWGFGPTKRPEKVPTDSQIAEVREYVGSEKLRVTQSGLQKTHPQVYVDLSTIAKGYGVDEIAAILEQQNIHDYLVEIGGEMRVKGQRGDGSGWLIAVEKPLSSGRAVQKVLSVGTNAVATSGDYRNYYEQDGVRYSHLIDPRSGKPIDHNLVAVTVVAPSSMTADGLATALNVMGWDAAQKLAEQENLAVLLIRHHNDEFEEYISTAFDETVEIKN